MTYGSNDGSSIPNNSQAGAAKGPERYHGGLYTDSSKGHLDHNTVPSPPSVPPKGQGAGGPTSVDTSSLTKFANNLDTLAEMLGDARNRVGALPDLAAGAFKEAEDLTAVVTGAKPGASAASTSGSGSGGSSSGSSSGSGTPDDSVDGRGGLRGNFHKSLHDLRQVLMDTAQNVRTLAAKYSTIEELNQKAGEDLRQMISTTEQDLQPIMNDAF
jgi:hypothetical protein